MRWNDTFGKFLHGLLAIHAYSGTGKEGDVRLIIVVEHVEKLIPELMVPLTRLAELVSPFTSGNHSYHKTQAVACV
jgi:origin recognition complex subunit 5